VPNGPYYRTNPLQNHRTNPYLRPMKVYDIRVLLHKPASIAWREIIITPDTDAQLLSDILLIAFRWDDDETFAFTNEREELMPEGEAYTIEKLVATLGPEIIFPSVPGDKLQLSFTLQDAIKGQLALPIISGGDGNNFDFEELNAELNEMLDEEGDSGLHFNASPNDPETPRASSVIDADADTEEISFQTAWLEAEYGLKVSEENVRNTPPDILAFRAKLTEADLASPRVYLRKIRPLFDKHPDDPLLNFEMAGLYGLTGEGKKSRQLLSKVHRKFSDNLEVLIHRALAMEDEDDFAKHIAELPRPLDIRNHPAGEDGYYHASEFLGFEEIAIRDAVIREDLNEARYRLDRLVQFGFLHGDVEQSAIAIAGMMLVEVQDKIQHGILAPEAPWSDAFSPVSERTDAILEVSMKEVAEMMRAYEQSHETVRREGPKVGRNDPCPCGSGRKFKKCCRGK